MMVISHESGTTAYFANVARKRAFSLQGPLRTLERPSFAARPVPPGNSNFPPMGAEGAFVGNNALMLLRGIAGQG